MQNIQQYQKTVHRLLNDALEINDFDSAKNIVKSSSFNNDMKEYILHELLFGRMKLIQNLRSYSIVKRLHSIVKI